MKKILVCFVLLLAIPFSVCRAGLDAPVWSKGFPRIDNNNVLLVWNPVAGAKEYALYRAAGGKGERFLARVSGTHYVDKEAVPGTVMGYTVSAVTAEGEGPRSALGSVYVPKVEEEKPVAIPMLQQPLLKMEEGGAFSVGIRWDGAEGSGLLGINVYRSTQSGGSYKPVGYSSGTSYVDRDVAGGKKYYYVVTAMDSGFKETGYSNEVAIDVPVPAKPQPPEQGGPEKPLYTEMRPARLLYRITKYTDYTGRPEEKNISRVRDIAVDVLRNRLYVSSPGYGGVLVYGLDGMFKSGIRRDGVNGKAPFDLVSGVAVGPEGDLYVADFSSPDIAVFDARGKSLGSITVDISREKPGARARIMDVAVDGRNNLYASDVVSNSIRVFDEQRRPAGVISGRDGKKELFNGPGYMAATAKGYILFGDSAWARVHVYDSSLKHVATIGKMGTVAGTLDGVSGVSIGPDGTVYAASGFSPNVQGFDSNGAFLFALCNESGDGPVTDAEIRGIFVDVKNRLFIAEDALNRVSVFQLEDRIIKVQP